MTNYKEENETEYTNKEKYEERKELVERGKRIKYIRENILQMKKAEFGRKIGVAGQYVTLVEEGKASLVYKSIRKLSLITGYSSDYILFGLDDNVIKETKELLKKYSCEEINLTIDTIKEIANTLDKKINN